MTRPHATILGTPAALQAQAAAWDQLWQASVAASPLLRAGALQLWQDHFSPQAPLTAVVVAQGARLKAALPLVSGTIARVIPCAKLPNDPWSLNGDLLLDEDQDEQAVLDELFAALERLAWPLFYFESIPWGAARWQRFLERAHLRGWEFYQREDCRFGCISIDDWESYVDRWSSSHRRHLRRAFRLLEEAGGQSLERIENPPADEIVSLIRRCFEIEHRSWKRDAGTSVLAHPGKLEYFTRLAQLMAAQGHLHLAFLRHGGEPIACEFGYVSKRTYFSPKIGYDASFRRFSPGQTLFHELLRDFHRDRSVAMVDTWGPLTETIAKWTTHNYSRGKLILAPPRATSRWMLRNLVRSRRIVQAWRQWRGNVATAVQAPDDAG